MVCFAFHVLSRGRYETKSLIFRLFLSCDKFISARAVCRFWRRTLLSFFAYFCLSSNCFAHVLFLDSGASFVSCRFRLCWVLTREIIQRILAFSEPLVFWGCCNNNQRAYLSIRRIFTGTSIFSFVVIRAGTMAWGSHRNVIMRTYSRVLFGIHDTDNASDIYFHVLLSAETGCSENKELKHATFWSTEGKRKLSSS